MGNSSSVEEPTQEEGAADEPRSINLLLCGLAGTGKSATGNHILGLQDKTFTVDDSDSPTTQKCEAISSKYKERDITVVDTPGLDDTNMDLHKEVNLLIEASKVLLHQTSTGYNAVLVTVRYGRQTRLDGATIEKFKDINGKSVLQRFGILVVTHGDKFKEQKGEDETIADYCSQQTGLVNHLWTECNRRVVLFDNVIKNEDEVQAQRNDLFATVMSMENTRYKGAMKPLRDSFIQLIRSQASEEIAQEVNGKSEGPKTLLARIEEKQNLGLMMIKAQAKTEARHKMLKKLLAEGREQEYKKYEEKWGQNDKINEKKIKNKKTDLENPPQNNWSRIFSSLR